jgi:hypothetical protein
VAPRLAPPLYDGVAYPDEAYRFVVQPAGAKATKAATTATGTTTVTAGRAGALRAASAEQAPQVSLLIPTGRLQAPAGTSRITLRATPAQPIPAPSGHYLWSNVYDVAATDPGVTMRDANPAATITLRAATAQRPYATIERYVNGTWTAVTTVPVGNDIYQATLPGLGRYAVVGSTPLSFSKATTSTLGIVVAVAAVVVVIALVVVGVLRRRRRADPDETDDLSTEEEPA